MDYLQARLWIFGVVAALAAIVNDDALLAIQLGFATFAVAIALLIQSGLIKVLLAIEENTRRPAVSSLQPESLPPERPELQVGWLEEPSEELTSQT